MTITVSVDELRKFDGDLSNWYARRAETIITRAQKVDGSGLDYAQVERVIIEFEKANPKPCIVPKV